MNSGAQRESPSADRYFVPDEQKFVQVKHDLVKYVGQVRPLVARAAQIQR
jgi:hypothetical protein